MFGNKQPDAVWEATVRIAISEQRHSHKSDYRQKMPGISYTADTGHFVAFAGLWPHSAIAPWAYRPPRKRVHSKWKRSAREPAHRPRCPPSWRFPARRGRRESPRRRPCRDLSSGFRINNPFNVTATVKYTYNCDSTRFIINQIIHNEIVYW